MTLEDVRKAKKRLEKERPIPKVGEAEYLDYNKRMGEYQLKKLELDKLEKELLEKQEILNQDTLGIIAKKNKQIYNRGHRIAALVREYAPVAVKKTRRAEILEEILDLEEEMVALQVEVAVLEDELIKGL